MVSTSSDLHPDRSAPRSSGKVRHAGIDLLRVLGVLAVVAGHIGTGYWIKHGLYSWHVPLFFYLAGYFWSSRRTVSEEIRNRWETIGKPYLFWLAVGTAIFVIPRVVESGSLKPLLPVVWGGALLTRPFQGFWFMTALLAGTVVYRLTSKSWKLSAAASITVLIAGMLAGQVVRLAPADILVGIACIIWILVGRVHRRHQGFPVIVWLSLLLCGFAVALLTAPLDLKQADFGVPVLSIVASLMICFGLVEAFSRLGGILRDGASRAITAAAQSSLAVVLGHGFVLEPLGHFTDRWFPGLLLAFAIPLAIGLVARRTVFSRWVTGSPRVEAKQR